MILWVRNSGRTEWDSLSASHGVCWIHSHSCTQLSAELGRTGGSSKMALVLAVCLNTLVLLLMALPQVAFLCSLSLQVLCLHLASFSSRIIQFFSCGVAELQELRQQLQGLLSPEFRSPRMFSSAAFKWSEQIARLSIFKR